MSLFSRTPIRSLVSPSLFFILLLPFLAASVGAAEAEAPKTLGPEGLRKPGAKKAEVLRAPDSPEEAQEYFQAKRAPAPLVEFPQPPRRSSHATHRPRVPCAPG